MTQKLLGLTMAALLGVPAAALAQSTATTGQALPNSNMAVPSGNTGSANNGAGNQGSLNGNAGSHSSTVKGAAAAAHIRTHVKPRTTQKGAKLEGDPAQGGGQQKQ